MRSLLVGLLLLCGCGPSLATLSDADSEVLDESLSAELKAALPSLTVWVRPTVVAEQRDGRRQFIVRGRASVNLEGVNSFVFDDVFGNARTLSTRTFDIAFDENSEFNSLNAGIRAFVSVYPVDHAKAATASLLFAPELNQPTGSPSIFVVSEVRPIAIGDALTYRALVRVTGGAELASSAGTVSRRPSRYNNEFNLDFTFAQWRDAGVVTLTAAGKTKQVTPTLRLKSLELTREDVETVWPPLQCEAGTQACLNTLSAPWDSSTCGNWYPVTRCQLPWRQP